MTPELRIELTRLIAYGQAANEPPWDTFAAIEPIIDAALNDAADHAYAMGQRSAVRAGPSPCGCISDCGCEW